MARNPTKHESMRADLRDLMEVLGELLRYILRPWVVVILIVTIVLILLYNREVIRGYFWEHLGSSCGSMGNVQVYPDGGDVEAIELKAHDIACFLHAYRACQTATLSYEKHGEDEFYGLTLIVEPTFGIGACGLGLREVFWGPSCFDSYTHYYPCGALVEHDGQVNSPGCFYADMSRGVVY